MGGTPDTKIFVRIHPSRLIVRDVPGKLVCALVEMIVFALSEIERQEVAINPNTISSCKKMVASRQLSEWSCVTISHQ